MQLEAILPQHIDSTMISCFRSCPRKFQLEFIYGLRPYDIAIDLHAGGVFAASLEKFQRLVHEHKLPVADAITEVTNFFISQWGDVEAPPRHPKTCDNMLVALHDYIRTYPPGTDHVQPFRSIDGNTTYEFSAAIPLDFPGFPMHPVTGEPFIYCGRFDLLGAYLGRPCVRDEKTTRAAGDGWAEQWDLRSQFMGYCWLGRQSGIEDLETVIVRGIVILKSQIKQLEAVKVFPDFMIDRWFEQLRHDLLRIVDCWNKGYFDFNLADSCMAFHRPCSFSYSCKSKEPESWLSDFRIHRWNPLFHNPIAEKDIAIS